MSDHDFPCVTNSNARTRLRQPVQDGSNQRQGFWGTIEPHRTGGHERPWRRAFEPCGDNADNGRTYRWCCDPSQVMQGAAFILNVREAVTLVAIATCRSVVMCGGDSGLVFEGMDGVVQHQRHHASNLGHQEQPKEPRTKVAA
jgi:hypothetical protein